MKNKLIFLFILTISTSFLFAQTVVTGTVRLSEDNSPLPGVSVIVKGTNVGAVTDFDGVYSITVPSNENILVFSYLGYKTQEIAIDGKLQVNCVLVEDLNELNEVVLIGYGAAKKTDVTGAVSSITSKSIEDRPIVRVEQALQGQIAGVSVRATTGELGAPLSISVRGGTSISAGTEPLYIVDGFPAEDISDLVPADIKSISVLKDASQAAIYGSRGANGVVIITTRTGESGKTKFTLNSYYGIQTVERKIDLLTAEEWIDINREVKNKAWVNLGIQRGIPYTADDSYDYRLSQLGGEVNTNYVSDPRWDTGEGLTYVDWQDELFRAAGIQEHQITASGGSENIKYYISGTILSQEGIIPYTDYQRLNFRSNINVKFNEKLSLAFNVSPTTSINTGGGTSGKDAQVHYALEMAPVVEEDAGINTGSYPYPTYQWAGSKTSPIAYLRELHQKDRQMSVRTNISLNYEIIKGLNARAEGSYYGASRTFHRYIPTRIASRNTNEEEGSLSNARLDTYRDNKYVAQGILSYDKTLGKHSFGALVGSAIESRWRDASRQIHNQINNDVLVTFNEVTSNVRTSYYQFSQDRLLSFFGRVNYNYDDRYLFSGSIRRDGSSRFGKNNFYGVFPSFSVGWRVDKESFMENVNSISMLKFRYGFGETGNNSIPLYRAFGNIATANYSFNEGVNFGNAIGSIENTDLGWEKTLSSNIGIDLGLFKNRVFLSVDYYDKKTSGMLLDVPVALSTGFSSGYTNIGAMRNKGYEIELTTKNLVNEFKWNTNLNFSHNKNEIEALGPNGTPIPTGFQNRTQIHQIGSAAFSYYMYDAIGVYKNQEEVDNLPSMANTIPGDVRYRDVNKDGVINEEDITIVGSPQPDFYWGFTNSFSYKFLDLSILIQGQQGGEVYGLIGRAIDNPSGATLHNRPAHWKNRWRSETDTGDGVTPRIDGTTAGLYDSRWLYDATYWKIKNITLSATLPENIIEGIDKFRVYVSADNVFMVDNYDIGFSPEALNTDGGDYGGYPLSRVISIGINLEF
ncbi:TonB-dependent receptor [Winogradskyella echinorum]|uniref:TonB-dependent receptor n=1 Tax=Winogradskyella echinorum TaxID=538189 RepID=A0ABR6Y1L2_9FLAO|nr:TonB-dependent receptor [Winogradskyella echinorum]MBC3846544.1 TonB-dependent receptor [Winogradskyella echinorum]MBC5750892.1 TonB-dependent receptor [Winogradskyella echinorum]